MRTALAAAIAAILLVPGVLLADDAVPVTSEPAPSTTPPAVAPSGDGATAAEPQAQEQTKPPAPEAKPQVVAASAKTQPRPKKPARVHAAGAGGVTIQNFAFAPATISIKAGDSVTWTNRDSAPHTATGNGGSFNTGTLKKGQSASHTFSKAGRFAYICAIHPNMHGTVVVAAASASAPSSGAGSPAAPAASPASPASTAPTLPNTGLQLVVVALCGAVFTAAGMAIKRLTLRSGR